MSQHRDTKGGAASGIGEQRRKKVSMDITSPASRDSQDTKPTPGQSATKKYKTRRKRIPGFVKILAVLVILAGIAGGIYIWRTQTTAAASTSPTLALPVTQGDLNVTVQSNGTLAANRQASITYQATGNVVQVMVKPGDKVEAGQTLLTQTNTDQQAAVDSAQAALNTAQAKLDDLKKGPTASDIASAQADVQAAQAALNLAKAGPTSQQLADAQADVRSAQANLASARAGATPKQLADAEADVQAAQVNYDNVKAGATPKQLADAEADVQAAQVNYDNVKAGATPKQISDAEQDLATAQAAYNQLLVPPTQDAVTQAQAQLNAAKASLAALKAQPIPADLSTAQLAVTQAQADLNTTQAADDLAKQQDQDARDKADHALQQAQLAYSVIASQVLNPDGTLNVPSSNAKYTTYWNDYYAMQNAQADQASAAAVLNNAVNKETFDINAAQAKLSDAKTQLAKVQAGATPDQLAAAEATVATDQKTFDDLSVGPTKSDLATAQSAVTKAQTALTELKAGPTAADLATAQDTLTKAQTALTELKAGPTAADLATAQDTLTKAQDALTELKAGPAAATVATAQTAADKAQDALNALLAGPTASSVAAAQATLAQKQAALATLMLPATASDIATAQQDVTTAQNNLLTAQETLAKTVLKAPFSGTVASVTAQPNDQTAVGTEALAIYDESGMYVNLQVNETDIQKLKPGEDASITVDALPNEVFTGTVKTVSNVSQTSQSVVTYEVDVDFNPRGLPVKTGMNATANLVVESHPNVIQVPTRAITSKGQNKSVTVLTGPNNQTPVTIGVTTGASNTTYTEITSCTDTGNQCLRPGDRVQVTLPTGTTTNNGANTGFGGGGFGGGGFGGGGFGGGGGRNGGAPVIIQGPGK